MKDSSKIDKIDSLITVDYREIFLTRIGNQVIAYDRGLVRF